jgi:hypothetical protein
MQGKPTNPQRACRFRSPILVVLRRGMPAFKLLFNSKLRISRGGRRGPRNESGSGLFGISARRWLDMPLAL